MGQTESSPYANSPQLHKALVSGTWPSLVMNSLDVVRMDETADYNPFQHKYIVKLNSQIPPDCNMTILFPNHPVESKRLLWVQRYTLNRLSLELNARIRESARDGLTVAVTSGNRVICFRGFIGNLYLVWAERVSQQTISRQENIIGEQIPLMIETNGQFRYRNVFIFDTEQKKLRLTPVKDISWFEPFRNEIFCCETDSRKDELRIVSTVSNSYADQVTKDPVVRSIVTLDEDKPPFYQEEEQELELQVDSGRLLNYEIHGDAKIPDEE